MKQFKIKVADLYIRTNTEEPAETYYSKTDQEKMLRRFCIIQSAQRI
jgi:hypothetical protein